MYVSAGQPVFLAVFDDVVPERLRNRYKGPSSLLDSWESLAAEVEDGYGFGFEELMNDLWVRDAIAKLLADPRASGDPMRDEFASAVTAVDDRYRSMLRPDVRIGPADAPWWQRGVLRSAGTEYADDMRDGFGIDVDLAE